MAARRSRCLPLSGAPALTPAPSLQLHFAGPADPRGRLRDLLAARIAAVPAGGTIHWVTYYFRDRRLAADLLHARERGVKVKVTLDGYPRTPRANRAVIALLAGPRGLGNGLRLVSSPADRWRWTRRWRPRLHSKLYYFSHPEPVALVGSFNPSGDVPELEPDVIREIRDQDGGWNLLVEIRDPALVAALAGYARRLHDGAHGPHVRFLPRQNRAIECSGMSLHFWPRLREDPVSARLRTLQRSDRLRVAASHVSGKDAVRLLVRLARRGVDIEMLADDPERRVPAALEARVAAAGVRMLRVGHPEFLPMHDKFLVADGAAGRWVAFGSFNWSQRSRRNNYEIGIISTDPRLCQAFARRWQAIRDYQPMAATGTGNR